MNQEALRGAHLQSFCSLILFSAESMQNQQNEVTQLQTDRALSLAANRATAFVRRHFFMSSLYVVGLVIAALASGFGVDPTAAAQFEAKLGHANFVTSHEMLHTMEQLRTAEALYHRHKGWFTCDQECTKYYERSNLLKEQLSLIHAKRDTLQREAKQSVGAWSWYGVTDIRKAFWDAWERGNEAARRMTMFDAVFIGLGAATGSSDNRDDSFLYAIFQILLQFLFNLTIGLLTSLVMFLFEAWNIIRSYGAPLFSALALFLLVVCSAAAVMMTAIGGVVGGLVGGVYLMARNAEKQARVEGRTFTPMRRLHID